jgi:branched-chain amino acid transport system permease protein
MEMLLFPVINGLLIGGIYSLMSVGLTLIFGVMGIVNFAHGELLMLGMYITYWGFTLVGIDPYLSLFICIIFLFVVGFLIQRVLIQPIRGDREMGSLLITLGLSIFLQNLALFLWKADFRSVVTGYSSVTLSVGDIILPLTRLITFFIAVVLTVLLYFFLKKTYTGKAIRATSQDRETAMLMGINISRVDLITFGIGAACVGAAGAITTPTFFVYPAVGQMFGLTCFVAVVLGGLGNFMGAFVAGLIVGIAESIGVVFLSTQAKYLATFIIFITVLLIKPTGIFGRR